MLLEESHVTRLGFFGLWIHSIPSCRIQQAHSHTIYSSIRTWYLHCSLHKHETHDDSFAFFETNESIDIGESNVALN